MGKACCAIGCTNRYSKGCGLSFYRFPVDPIKRAQWIAAVGRKDWQPTEYNWICSAHFVGGFKSNDPLSPAYIPSIFVHVDSPVKKKAQQDMARYERNKATRKKKLEEYLMEPAEPESEHEIVPAESTMTVLSMEYIDLEEENRRLREDNQRLKEETSSLKDDIAKQQLDECSLKNDQIKVKFYTGLPYFALLKIIFDFVAPFVPSTRSKFPKFQQFLMVLMKLRLNVADQDLGYRFGIHQSTVSRNFRKWIDVLHDRLNPLILWPEHEELLKTMPMEFKGNVQSSLIALKFL